MRKIVLTLTALLLTAVSACAAQSLGEAARQARKEKQPAAHVFTNDNLPTDAPISVTGQPATPPAEAGDKASVPSADKASADKATDDKAADNKAAKDDKAKGDKTADDKANATAEKAAEDKTGKTDKAVAADDKSTGDRSTATAQSVESEADSKDTGDDSAAASRQKMMDEWKSKFAKQRQEIHLNERELDVLMREYRLRAAAFYADAGNRLRNQEQWSREDQQYRDRIAQKQKQLDDSKQTLEDMKEQARKDGMPSSVAEAQ